MRGGGCSALQLPRNMATLMEAKSSSVAVVSELVFDLWVRDGLIARGTHVAKSITRGDARHRHHWESTRLDALADLRPQLRVLQLR